VKTVRDQVAWLVALGFLVMFLSCAIKGVYQVWFTAIADHFGRGRGDFALSASLFMLAGGASAPLVGALADRMGPMRTVSIGCVLAGAALLGAALLPSNFGLFVLLYGGLAAVALTAMTYVPMGVLVDRLFSDGRKGIAYAVVTNGTAIGFIALSPLWFWLQGHLDWQAAFSLVGMVFLAPLAAVTWWAAGMAPPAQVQAAAESRGDWHGAMRDPGFYVLALGFMGCGATMALIDVHLVPFWQDSGVDRASMGLSLSMLGVLELVSGVAAGWLAMRLPKHLLLSGFYLVRSVAMLLLLSQTRVVSTFGFAIVFGASYLGTVVLTSAFCLDRYGARIKGQVFGALFACHQFGAFLSVQLGAAGFDRFGSYQPAIATLFVLTMLASVLSLFLGAERRTSVHLAVERSA